MDCDVLCLPTEDNLCEVMYVCASVLITEIRVNVIAVLYFGLIKMPR